jgi:site-specific recombinase XerD
MSFLNKCGEFLSRRYNSEQTIKCYLNEIKGFIKEFNDPYQINLNDIQTHLDKYKDFGRSKQNQVIASMKCLYLDILGRKNFKYRFTRAKKIEYLPTLMSKEEVKSRLNNIPNLKHKTICSLLYGCGLRLNEVINFKIEHILKNQHLLKIVQGKGAKDRFIPISENLLNLLREYFIYYKPKEYLFNGQSEPQYSEGSIQKIVKKYFGNNFHPHLLRHCYGTHLVESGVELNKIQKLMGHKDIKSTQIYTKTANNLQNLPHLL